MTPRTHRFSSPGPFHPGYSVAAAVPVQHCSWVAQTQSMSRKDGDQCGGGPAGPTRSPSPSDAMRAAMAAAEVDDGVRGADPTARAVPGGDGGDHGQGGRALRPVGDHGQPRLRLRPRARTATSGAARSIILGDDSHIHLYENSGRLHRRRRAPQDRQEQRPWHHGHRRDRRRCNQVSRRGTVFRYQF